MKTIKEIKFNGHTKNGVYLNNNGEYTWMTLTRSGTCKKLATAMKKAGL